MRIIATIEVNLDVTPLGTRPRWNHEIAGDTVLARTIRQTAAATKLAGVFVICPIEQQERCAALIEGLPAELRVHEAGPPPYQALVRIARKWSLDGWRGGIGGASAMDEYTHLPVVAGLAGQEQASAVAVVPGPCPLIDPVIVDRLIDHFLTVSEETRMTFMQTPPGLSPFLFQTALLQEIAQAGIPPGWTMSYKPDRPETDPARRKCACNSPPSLRHAAGRMITDCSHAVEIVNSYLSEREYGGAEDVGQWLLERDRSRVSPMPREVEIELTTQDPLGETSNVRLRPRVSWEHQRGPLDRVLVKKLAEELAVNDDALVVLGGFGDPVLHPDFPQIVTDLRNAGIYGIAVRTSGLHLTDDVVQALLDNRVDVLSVLIDAWSADLYFALHGRELSTVTQGIEKLATARRQRGHPAPLVVPEMVKSKQTLDEMQDFFDEWIRRSGWATLVGFSNYAGTLPDLSVTDMSPPVRTACRRILSRCTVLADGMLIACDQDFQAVRPVGSIARNTLHALWTSDKMTALREHHRQGCFNSDPLCPACREWHRP